MKLGGGPRTNGNFSLTIWIDIASRTARSCSRLIPARINAIIRPRSANFSWNAARASTANAFTWVLAPLPKERKQEQENSQTCQDGRDRPRGVANFHSIMEI